MSSKKQIIMTPCKCGCGADARLVYAKGRVRTGFLHGHNKGHSMPHSEEVIEILRALPKGKKSSDETRRKQSTSMKASMISGKHPCWKGGITKVNELIRKSVEYKLWREAVFKRDNFTCVWCGEKESVSGKLEADHIKPFALFPALRLAIDNGRTLFRECHKKTDTYLWKCQKLIQQSNN